MSNDEFLRRYLEHVLPKGFVGICHYGFFSQCISQAEVSLN
ncbi:MAG: transposase [Pseudoalteromonas sp.]|nr:transposase [Pseudoalteromonas sp.]